MCETYPLTGCEPRKILFCLIKRQSTRETLWPRAGGSKDSEATSTKPDIRWVGSPRDVSDYFDLPNEDALLQSSPPHSPVSSRADSLYSNGSTASSASSLTSPATPLINSAIKRLGRDNVPTEETSHLLLFDADDPPSAAPLSRTDAKSVTATGAVASSPGTLDV